MKKREEGYNKLFLMFIIVGIILALIVFLDQFSLTGNAISLEKNNYLANEKINGQYILSLKEGELIPENSKVILQYGNEEKEYSLQEFIELTGANLEQEYGEYYLENSKIEGEGFGFGSVGNIVTYPEVVFKFIINQEINETNETIIDESIIESTTNESTFNETEIQENNLTENNESTIDEIEINIIEENQVEEIPTEEINETTEENIILEEQTEQLAEEPVEEIIEAQSEEPIIEEITLEENPSEETPETETSSEDLTEQTDSIEQTESSEQSESTYSEDSSTESESESSEQSTESSSSDAITGNFLTFFAIANKFVGIWNGFTILEDMDGEISGTVSKNYPFYYTLEPNEEIEIIGNSITDGEEELSESLLNIERNEDKIQITTDYSKTEFGFGEEYIGKTQEYDFNLENINLSLNESGNYSLKISIVYNENIIDEQEILFKVIGNPKIKIINRKGNTLDEILLNDTEASIKLEKIKINGDEEYNLEEIGKEIEKETESQNAPSITGGVISEISEELASTELNFNEIPEDLIIQIDKPTEELKNQGLGTEIIAVQSESNQEFSIDESQILLEKTTSTPINKILYCDDWNLEEFNCNSEWQDSGLDFIDNGTYVSFNVTHFTAYVGSANMTCPYYVTEDVVLVENVSCSDDAFIVNTSNVIIDCNGHSIIGSGADDWYYGILINNSNNVTIQNCEIQDFGYAVAQNTPNVLNTTILNSNFHENYYGFITLGTTNYTTIYNSNLSDNLWRGIYLDGNYNNISNNNLSNNGWYGFETYGDNNSYINNIINLNGWDGSLIFGINNNISFNEFNNNFGTGLALLEENNTLMQNTFDYNSYEGLFLDSGSTGNTILDIRACFNNQDDAGYYDVNDEDSNIFSNTTCETSNPGGICDNSCDVPPVAMQISPDNETTDSDLTQTFSCNITDDFGISKLELAIYNSTGQLAVGDNATGEFDVLVNETFQDDSNYEWPYDSAIDADGNFLIMDEAESNKRMIIVKYDSDGTLLDTFDELSLTDYSDYQLHSLTIDPSNNAYAVGTAFWHSDSDDLLLTKYNSDGDLLFNKTFYVFDGINQWGKTIRLDGDGNLIIFGLENDYGFLMKVDTDGNEIWNKTFISEYTGYTPYQTMDVDSSNNIYFLLNQGDRVFLLKSDTDGNEIWNETITQGYDTDDIYGIDVEGDGIYLAGYVYTSPEGYIWTARYDLDGNEIWTNIDYGVIDDEAGVPYANSLVVGSEVYLTGWDVLNDPYYPSNSTYGGQMMLLTYDKDTGELLGNQSFGEIGMYDEGTTIKEYSGELYLAGYTESYGTLNGDLWFLKVTPIGGYAPFSTTLTGIENETSWEVELPDYDDYSWMCIGYDILGQTNETENWTLTIEAPIDGVELGCIGENYNFTCGDTINESCTMNTNLECNSTPGFTIGANNLIINGDGHWLGGYSGENGIDIIDLDNITIRGFDIYSFAEGIYMENVNNSMIKDNIVEYNTNMISAGVGISVYQGNNNTFLNNSIFSNGGATGAGGILFDQTTNSIIRDNSIYNHMTGNGIDLTSVSGILVDNCTIYGNRAGISIQNSDDNNITNNNLSDNGGDGLTVANGYDNILRNNTMIGNSNYQMILSGDSENNTIQNLTLADDLVITVAGKNINIDLASPINSFPTGWYNFSKNFVEITNNTEINYYALVSFRYNETTMNAQEINESSLSVWGLEDDGTWLQRNSTVNASDNILSMNDGNGVTPWPPIGGFAISPIDITGNAISDGITGLATWCQSNPNPDLNSCINSGCSVGYTCNTQIGCHTTSCTCTGSSYICLDNCGGGECIPIGLSIFVPLGQLNTTPTSSGGGTTAECGDGSCNGDETCSSCETDCGTCYTCGNAKCEATLGETIDNCPADCCGTEGQIIIGDEQTCCIPLIAVRNRVPGLTGCVDPINLAKICINCGNGICGTGENSCNCPIDCNITNLTLEWAPKNLSLTCDVFANSTIGLERTYSYDSNTGLTISITDPTSTLSGYSECSFGGISGFCNMENKVSFMKASAYSDIVSTLLANVIINEINLTSIKPTLPTSATYTDNNLTSNISFYKLKRNFVFTTYNVENYSCKPTCSKLPIAQSTYDSMGKIEGTVLEMQTAGYWYDCFNNLLTPTEGVSCSDVSDVRCSITPGKEGWYAIKSDGKLVQLTSGTCTGKTDLICPIETKPLVKYKQRILKSTSTTRTTDINWIVAPNNANTSSDLLVLARADYIAEWNPALQNSKGVAYGKRIIQQVPEIDGQALPTLVPGQLATLPLEDYYYGQPIEYNTAILTTRAITSPITVPVPITPPPIIETVLTGRINVTPGKPYFVSYNADEMGTDFYDLVYLGDVPNPVTFEFKVSPNSFNENYLVLPLNTTIKKASQLCDPAVSGIPISGDFLIWWNPEVQDYSMSTRTCAQILQRPSMYDFNLTLGRVYKIYVTQDATWTQR